MWTNTLYNLCTSCLTFSREFNSLYAVNLVCTQTANEVHLRSRGFTVHKSFIRKYVQKYGCPKNENRPSSNCITWSSDFTNTQWYTARGDRVLRLTQELKHFCIILQMDTFFSFYLHILEIDCTGRFSELRDRAREVMCNSRDCLSARVIECTHLQQEPF